MYIEKNKTSVSKKVCIDAILVSCSVILASLGNFTLPFLTFIKLDFSDTASFLATLLFGGYHGVVILFVTSIIRMFTGDVFTLNAFIMRMLSSIIIVFLNIYRKSNRNFYVLATSSILLRALVGLPFSYHMWIHHFSVPKETYFNQMLPSMIVAIFIRNLINLFISKILYNHISKKIFNVKSETQ